MANYDWSGVALTYNRTPPNYTAGETMTITVSGQVKRTGDPTTETATLTGTLQATDGTQFTLTAQPVQVTRPGQVTMLNVTLVSLTDSSGRVWTVAANGLSASAVA